VTLGLYYFVVVVVSPSLFAMENLPSNVPRNAKPPSSTDACLRKPLNHRRRPSFTRSLSNRLKPQHLLLTNKNNSFRLPKCSSENNDNNGMMMRRRSLELLPPRSNIYRGGHRRRNSIGAERIAQRSSSKKVKTTLAMLHEMCQAVEHQQESGGSSSSCNITILPPHDELQLLEQLATDAYYRVIMTKYQGIDTLTKAMDTFEQHSEIQESCRQILSLLNESLKEEPIAATKSPTSFSSNLSSLPVEATSPEEGEDIRRIINQGCRLLVDRNHNSSEL
jgi:hypothetical protein